MRWYKILSESLGVLRESPQWNPKSYVLDTHPSTYSEKFADNTAHVNWAGVKINMGEQSLYFIVSVVATPTVVHFLESTSSVCVCHLLCARSSVVAFTPFILEALILSRDTPNGRAILIRLRKLNFYEKTEC